MRLIMIVLCCLLSLPARAADSILVTAASGGIVLETGSGKLPLEAYVRLHPGDRLTLPGAATLGLLYVGSGRLESWQGAGSIRIGDEGGKAVAGKPALKVRQLPAEVARQMNRMPTTSQEGRVGMLRMRTVPPLDAIARVEREYAALRDAATGSDLTPEIYLLAGLFDLRQYERLKNELTRIERDFPQHPGVASLRQLYGQALPGAPSGER